VDMFSGSSQEQVTWSNFDKLTPAQCDDLRAAYASAAPFPHLVIEGLFPADRLRAVAEDFDAAPPATWRNIQSGLQRKRATPPDSPLPACVQDYFNTLNSGPFIRFLSDITGVSNLIPDPALHGGGMHEVGEGGAFEIHIDFEQHPRTLLSNRLVVITYLNDDWAPTDGGSLELWYTKPPRCAASITPIFGRTVILQQSRLAAHGHPQPIRQGRKRRSVTAYFYTNGLAAASANNMLSTTYIAHKGYSMPKRIELGLRLIVPPIVLMSLKSIKAAAQSTFMRAH
jgi:hypothetical protein